MKKVLGLAVAMAAASQANAALTLPNTDVANTGGSELILVVWDDVSKTTYTRDLGTDYTAFSDATSFSIAADSLLTSTFGTSLSSSLVWGVWAADTVFTGAVDENEFGYVDDKDTWGLSIKTTSAVDVDAITKQNTSALFAAGTKLTTFLNSSNSLSSHNSTADGSSVAVVGQNSTFSSFNAEMKTNWAGNFGASSVVAVGSSAYFVMVQDVVDEEDFDVSDDQDGSYIIGEYSVNTSNKSLYTAYQGMWTLGADGTLSWNSSVAAVPVPAAAWLFASGLAGLAGVARRRKAA